MTGSKGRDRLAVVIPAYNHESRVTEVILAAKELPFPIFVVDDGSTDGTYERIRVIPDISILRHRENRGKGAALLTGFAAASTVADWAATVDADGQHNPKDVLKLWSAVANRLEKSSFDAAPASRKSNRPMESRRPFVVGLREEMTGPEVPWTSRFGRSFSNFWVQLAGGPEVRDSQSGLRLYPLPEALHLGVQARRFQFEVEILVRAQWQGYPVLEVPIGVTYQPGAERISHFRPFVDFLRNSCTFSRLIALRILVPRRCRMTPGRKNSP
ncbi:Glycosyl transferase family 2 [Syntrophus gentianae]|uniref:Glycosyl transferase family 2 n=1 Tax=Syntrophus gentianae TaxID=43775 RepID=A0A1H7WWI3_9BACT|nr:glycosyltransferase family 2 protein [Syntrophus gentianae]SEM25665.1 Glycosyl transferase family 2 [Syntrophus gentianae]